jgi:phage-related protein
VLFRSGLVLLLGILGFLLATGSAINLFLGSFGLTLGGILAPLLPLIVTIGILIGIFWLWDAALKALGLPGLWEGVTSGIQFIIDCIKQLWVNIQLLFLVDIPNAIKSVIQWFMDLPKNIKQAIDNFVIFVRNGINSIIDWFKNLPMNIWNTITALAGTLVNIGKNMIQWLIDGIKSMATKIKDAFWNILPTWLQNAISGVGTIAKTVLKAFGGLFGMQEGGIVTRPTPALIGERGPEAVVPLDRMGGMSNSVNITNPNIYLTSVVGKDPTERIVREVIDKLGLGLVRAI